MGRRRALIIAAAVVLLVGAVVVFTVVRSDDDKAVPRPGVPTEPLAQLAAKRNIAIGVGANQRRLANPGYQSLIGDTFNSITGQSAFKWETTEPRPNEFTFAASDRVVNFAEQHHMRVRGHTLIWHLQNPPWLTQQHWTRATLLPVMKRHIMTVVGHYRGRVAQWDVVNEAFNAITAQPRQSIWERVIGPEYVALAFRWAHEADPDAQLFYNDFGIEVPGPHFRAVFNMVRTLRARGVPIGGVGLQSHLSLQHPVTADMRVVMQRFASLGVNVEITELDVPVAVPAGSQVLEQQGRVFGLVTAFCLAVRQCTGVTVWGADDNDTYPAISRQHLDASTLFDRTGARKPAYDGVAIALERAPGPTERPSPGRRL